MTPKEKSYGFIGVDMPRDVALRMALLQRAIPAEDLYTDKAGHGLEQHPHVTVSYGHEDQEPTATKAALQDMQEGDGSIGPLSHFQQKDYKVLKFDVDSEHLHSLNKRLRERIKHPGLTFDEYQPHVTVAYLKPDTDISKYTKLERLLKGRKFPVKHLRWGNPKDEYTTLSLAEQLEKTAADPAPAKPQGMAKYLRLAEGAPIPTAKKITNSAGIVEPHKTVGTGHYLSPANTAKLTKLWGKDRYKAIAGGAPINTAEDTAATNHHMSSVVPSQLDRWNPRWRKLNPMLQNWLKLHTYALGDNISKFNQGSNAVNAMAVNPSKGNLAKLWQSFWDSKYRKQTGTRMDKLKPLFESGSRIALMRKRNASK